MSEQEPELGLLRGVASPGEAASLLGGAQATHELFVRHAQKDGRRVVLLRCVDSGSGCVVECDVYPVTGLSVEPLQPGPYVFPTYEAAKRFVEEASASFEYLGCTIS